ncbi:hypothetical protein BB561_005678 [Smittium simulii]|uniref:DH domain-containing protein n=1 Tax=Smittium simulii TaxID=133385 RepID=A0A2T9Y909_9FUNG|nr:hypothetical protein BB561_005678 [Smittium simulii]
MAVNDKPRSHNSPEKNDQSFKRLLKKSKSFLLLNFTGSTIHEPMPTANLELAFSISSPTSSISEHTNPHFSQKIFFFKKNFYGYHQSIGPLLISIFSSSDSLHYRLNVYGIKAFEIIYIDKTLNLSTYNLGKSIIQTTLEDYSNLLNLVLIEYLDRINYNRVAYLSWFFNLDSEKLISRFISSIGQHSSNRSFRIISQFSCLSDGSKTKNSNSSENYIMSTSPEAHCSDTPISHLDTANDQKIKEILEFIKFDTMAISTKDIVNSLDENTDADISDRILSASKPRAKKTILIDVIVLDENTNESLKNQSIIEFLKILDSFSLAFTGKSLNFNRLLNISPIKESKPNTQKKYSPESSSHDNSREFQEFEKLAKNLENIKIQNDSLIARQNIINEIITTEESYIKQLGFLIEKYAKPLKNSVENMSKESSITYSIRVIFGNIISLLPVNEKFLSDLKNSVDKSQKSSATNEEQNDFHSFSVGKICNFNFKNFTCYQRYIAGYSRSIEQSKKLEKTSSFYSSFLYNASKDKSLGRLGFYDLLVIPVQRIPRYDILLSQLIKVTSSDSEDYMYLQLALKRIRVIGKLTHDPSVSTYSNLMSIHRHKTARKARSTTPQINLAECLDNYDLELLKPPELPSKLESKTLFKSEPSLLHIPESSSRIKLEQNTSLLLKPSHSLELESSTPSLLKPIPAMKSDSPQLKSPLKLNSDFFLKLVPQLPSKRVSTLPLKPETELPLEPKSVLPLIPKSELSMKPETELPLEPKSELSMKPERKYTVGSSIASINPNNFKSTKDYDLNLDHLYSSLSSLPTPDYNPLDKPVTDSVFELFFLHSLIDKCPANLISARRSLISLFRIHETNMLDFNKSENSYSKVFTPYDYDRSRKYSNDSDSQKKQTKGFSKYSYRNKSLTNVNIDNSKSSNDLCSKNVDVLHSSSSNNLFFKKKQNSFTILIFSDSLMIVENFKDSLPFFSYDDMFVIKSVQDRDSKHKLQRQLAEDYKNKKIGTIISWISISNVQLTLSKNSTKLNSFYLNNISPKCKDLNDFNFGVRDEKSDFNLHDIDILPSSVESAQKNELDDDSNINSSDLLLDGCVIKLDNWNKISNALYNCSNNFSDKRDTETSNVKHLNSLTSDPNSLAKLEKNSIYSKPNSDRFQEDLYHSDNKSDLVYLKPAKDLVNTEIYLDRTSNSMIRTSNYVKNSSNCVENSSNLTESTSNYVENISNSMESTSNQKSQIKTNQKEVSSIFYGKDYWYPISFHKFYMQENQDITKLERSINLSKMLQESSNLDETEDIITTNIFERKSSFDLTPLNTDNKNYIIVDIEVDNQIFKYRIWTYEKYYHKTDQSKINWRADSTLVFDARNLTNKDVKNCMNNTNIENQKLNLPNLLAWITLENPKDDNLEISYDLYKPEPNLIPNHNDHYHNTEYNYLKTYNLSEKFLYSTDLSANKNINCTHHSIPKSEILYHVYALIIGEQNKQALYPSKYLEKCNLYQSILGNLFGGLTSIFSEDKINKIFAMKSDSTFLKCLENQINKSVKPSSIKISLNKTPPVVMQKDNGSTFNSFEQFKFTTNQDKNDDLTKLPVVKADENNYLSNAIAKFKKKSKAKPTKKKQKAKTLQKKNTSYNYKSKGTILKKTEPICISPNKQNLVGNYSNESNHSVNMNSISKKGSLECPIDELDIEFSNNSLEDNQIETIFDFYKYALNRIFKDKNIKFCSVPIIWPIKYSNLNDIFEHSGNYTNSDLSRNNKFLRLFKNKMHVKDNKEFSIINCYIIPTTKNLHDNIEQEQEQDENSISASLSSIISLIALSVSFISKIPDFDAKYHNLTQSAISYFKSPKNNTIYCKEEHRKEFSEDKGIDIDEKTTISGLNDYQSITYTENHKNSDTPISIKNKAQTLGPASTFIKFFQSNKNSKKNNTNKADGVFKFGSYRLPTNSKKKEINDFNEILESGMKLSNAFENENVYNINEILKLGSQRLTKASSCPSNHSNDTTNITTEDFYNPGLYLKRIEEEKKEYIYDDTNTVNKQADDRSKRLKFTKTQYYDASLKKCYSDEDFVIIKEQ